MNKEKMINIENAFKVLKENINSEDAIEILKNSAKVIFSYDFTISVIDPAPNSHIFVMSVYPDRSTMDKIVDAIINNDSHGVSKLWSKTKEWTIEIDKRIFDENVINLSEKELAAVFCHEIGHVIQSNSIPNRIITILQYELIKSKVSSKSIIRDKFFKKILTLPIINACMGGGHDGANLKNEMKADKFAVSMGYRNELISVFNKLKKYRSKNNPDKEMQQMAYFSIDAVNQFKNRETSLLENTINAMIADCSSVYAESVLVEIKNDFFYENAESSVTKEKRLNFLYERAEQLEEEFICTEFFGLGKKSLKRIDPAEIDLMSIKIKSIKNNSDKMMIISFIHSKLDIVEYYISLLKNPKQAKKYNIPYSLKELEDLKEYLNNLINQAINAKLPERFRNGLLIAWPTGYEG